MKWPAMVRFENSDELDIIESKAQWESFLQTANGDCDVILSNAALYKITVNTDGNPSYTESDELISVDLAVELARKHMAAQAHCCVSKFYAPSVEAVIRVIAQLED